MSHIGIRHGRRALSLGFGVVAAALTVSSVAYACTSLQGKMTVTGKSGTQSVVVGNTKVSHTWCSVAGGAKAEAGGQVTIDLAPYVNSGSGDTCPSSGFAPSADAAGGPTWVRNPNCWIGDVPIATCQFLPAGGTDLPAGGTNLPGGGFMNLQGKGIGTYDVRVAAGSVFSRSGATYTGFAGNSCLESGAFSSIGSLTVAQNGTATWTGNVSSGLAVSSPTDSGGVCVHAARTKQDGPAPSLADPFSEVFSRYYVDNGPVEVAAMAPLIIIL